MTTFDALSALRRRWPVLLIGVILTGLAMAGIRQSQHSYYGQVDVRFFIPISAKNPNVIQTSSSAMSQTAALVRTRLDRGHVPAGTTISLDIQGGPHRSQVSLPNTGSQFVPLFGKPTLSLEATGPSEADVRRALTRIARQVADETLALQVESHVAPVNRITTRNEPARPQVVELVGRTTRALGAVLGLGLVATVWVTVEVDRLFARRRRRRRRPVQATN